MGAAILLTASGSVVAFAQDAKRPTERPRDETEAGQEQSVVARAGGDLLARTLLRRSRALVSPTTADYRLTALGLRLARRTAPEDAELLRHEIEAWTAADDAARMIEATRELVRLDTRDTIAQLRLIDTQIGRLNTVEERRAAYDRLLGPAGKGLRAPIRSRLALDAALLAREGGDDERFLELLTESTLLDGTNKNAAALYASVLLQFADTPIERFELIANVLQSDPLDLGAYENAAIELLAHGAYEGALRYLDRMRDLLGRTGQDFMSRAMLTQPGFYDEARVNDYLICTWQNEGPREVLSYIADAQGQLEGGFIAEVRAMQERGFSQEQMQEAMGQRDFPLLPHQLERFRLLTLIGQPGDEASGMAFTQRPLARDEYSAELNPFGLSGYIEPPAASEERITELQREFPNASIEQIRSVAGIEARRTRAVNPVHEAATRYMLSARELNQNLRAAEGIDPQTVRMFEFNLALEIVWALLVAEISADLAEERLDGLIESVGEDALEADAVQRYRGWIACNRGDFETARELLTPLAEDDATAIYALAMTEYRSGNTDRALELFGRLRVEFPQTVLACVARDRTRTISGSVPAMPAYVRELDQYALSFAPWIERYTRSPREFMSLTVRPRKTTLGPLDRAELVLLLTNTAGRPMAVGPNSPINSRFLLTPRLEIEGTSYMELVRESLRRQAKRELDLDPDASFPDEIASRVEQIIEEQVTGAGRRLLEVVDANRVLRLEPNETIAIPIWAGRGNAGEIIDRDLTERVTVQWSIAQGFVQSSRPNPDGSAAQNFTAGPMSVSTGTDRQLRIKLPAVSAEVLVERLKVGQGNELAQTLLHATSLISRAAQTEPSDDDAAQIDLLRRELTGAARTLPVEHLTLLLMRSNELGIFNTDQELRRDLRDVVTERFVDGSVAESEGADLLLVGALVSLTRAADEPLLRIALESSDPAVAEFASVLSRVLEESGYLSDPDTLDVDPSVDPTDPGLTIDEGMLGTPQGK